MGDKVIDFLKLNLKNACLESFSIKKQFLELEFSNSKFEEIMFFIDCNIYSLDLTIEDIIKPLKKVCKDTYVISYFIFFNLQLIEECKFNKEGNFEIFFSGRKGILFDLNSYDDANISVTFKEKKADSKYIAIDIRSNIQLELNDYR